MTKPIIDITDERDLEITRLQNQIVHLVRALEDIRLDARVMDGSGSATARGWGSLLLKKLRPTFDWIALNRVGR